MLSPERLGKFTASQIHRLMAEGKVDFSPERMGAKGFYSCLEMPGVTFNTVAEYENAIKEERKKMARFTLSQGAETYAEECAMEMLFSEDPEGEPEFENSDSRRGKEREAAGVIAFELHTGLETSKTGEQQEFIVSPCGLWGGTPDGIASDGATIEGKSPMRKYHLSYMLRISDGETLKKEDAGYYWQVQAQIALQGAPYGHWYSFNPKPHNKRASIHAVIIERNQADIDRMIGKIRLAAEYRDAIVRRIMGV